MNINDSEVKKEMRLKKKNKLEDMPLEDAPPSLYNFSATVSKTFKLSKHYLLKWADWVMNTNQ